MRVLITGGTGFIGSALIGRLLSGGNEITVLTRTHTGRQRGIHYLQNLSELPDDIEIDTVVNLAGASLAARRWTDAYKQELVLSRLDITRSLVALIGRLESKPRVLVSASAIGYYGHHADEELDEDASVNPGFAQDLCSNWEALALEAEQHGVRVCLARLGVVLDREGGAMDQMSRPFHFGVANWLGSGRQWLSWIHRRDAVSALCLMLDNSNLSGAFNVTAPQPVTSRGFCEAMKLHKKTFITLPVPATAMRLMVGPMADELLLRGQRVVPTRLQSLGMEFEFPDLDSTLAAILRGTSQ